jgi:hypothetical protein
VLLTPGITVANPLIGPWEDDTSSYEAEFLGNGRMLERSVCARVPLRETKYSFLENNRILTEGLDGAKLFEYEISADTLLLDDTSTGERLVLSKKDDDTGNFTTPLSPGETGQGFAVCDESVLYYEKHLFREDTRNTELRFGTMNDRGDLYTALWDIDKGGLVAAVVNVQQRKITIPAFAGREDGLFQLPSYVVSWSPDGAVGVVKQVGEVTKRLWILRPGAAHEAARVALVVTPELTTDTCEMQVWSDEPIDWSEWTSQRIFSLVVTIRDNPWTCNKKIPPRSVPLLVSINGEISQGSP